MTRNGEEEQNEELLGVHLKPGSGFSQGEVEVSDVQSLCPTGLDDKGILGKENLAGANVACGLTVC